MKNFPTKMKRKIGALKGHLLCGAPNGASILPFTVYLLNQGLYRISEHCSTIFITPIIILNTKNRGSLGALGAKVRQILCVVWKTCVLSIRKQCLAAIEAISRLPGTVFHESTGSYRHVQKIPTPKKRFDGILWMFFWGGAAAPGGGAASKGPYLEKVMKQSIACAGL